MRLRTAAVLGSALLLAGCGQQGTTPATQAAAFDMPADAVAYGVEHIVTHAGVRRAVIHSDTAYTYESTRQVEMVGVRVEFFNDAGQQIGTLTSHRGDYDVGTSVFTAKEEVVLVSQTPEGERRLLTEELGYDVNTDRLWSDVPFTLHEGDRVTKGTSFRSDSRFETWSITGAETSGTVEDDGELSF